VRSDTSRDSDEVPGVSMIVVSISSAAGHSTSRSTTVLRVEAGEVERQGPVTGVPRDGYVGTAPAPVIRRHLGGGPVAEPGHDAGWASVASVGAMSSPTSALTRVDLPALSVPAQGDADGLVQAPADPVQLVVHVGTLAVGRIGTVRLDGAAKDRAHSIAGAHGVTSLSTTAARSPGNGCRLGFRLG